MAVHNKIEYEKAENLFLDQKNPRLGRHNVDKALGQDEILKLMQKYTLDELVVSIAHSGFWPQEAVIVVEDKVDMRRAFCRHYSILQAAADEAGDRQHELAVGLLDHVLRHRPASLLSTSQARRTSCSVVRALPIASRRT